MYAPLTTLLSCIVATLCLVFGQQTLPPASDLCVTQHVPHVQRHFYHHIEGGDHYSEQNITIANSHYFPLRLINENIRQLVIRHLGYHNTTYSELDATHSHLPPNITCSVGDYKCWPPNGLIRIQSSRSDVDEYFTDVGGLGLSTQYGFYQSSSVVGEQADTYSYMSRSDSVQNVFSTYHNNIDQFVSSHADPTCTVGRAGCVGELYISSACRNVSCLSVAIGDTDLPQSDITHMIEKLNLPFRLLYVAHHLNSFILNHTQSGVPVLFFSRSHDTLSSRSTFTRLRPERSSCYLEVCDFPVLELRKVMWTRLITSEPLIYQLLYRYKLNESMVHEMTRLYSASYQEEVTPQNIQQFTCGWLSHNSNFLNWIPSEARDKPKLHIGGFFPLERDQTPWAEPSLLPAAYMSIEIINNDSTVLGGYELHLDVEDTRCDSAEVLNIFTDFRGDDQLWPSMIGGLGPFCSHTALDIAGLATKQNYIVISYAAEAMELSLYREKYKYFFRTRPQITDYAQVYVALFTEMGWTDSRLSMITEGYSVEFSRYHQFLGDVFRENKIVIAHQESLPKREYLTEKGVHPEVAYGEYLDRIKASNSHIIIMDAYEQVAASIMCAAYHKEMTMKQGYIWFLPNLYFWDWYDVKYLNVTCSNDEMLEALRGYFTLAHSNIDKTDTVAVGGMTGLQFQHRYNERLKRKKGMHPSDYGPYAYDAVWTFAKALEALHNENPAYLKYIHSEYATQRYAAMIQNTTFQGVSGAISFSAEGERSGITEIKQYNLTGPDQFLLQTIVGNWSSSKNGSTKLYLNRTMIQWGKLPITPPPEPADTITCEWESLRVGLGFESCIGAFLLVVILTCSLLIILIIIAAVTIITRAKNKYRHAVELASRLGEGRYSQALNLDEKEIPREHVVLNRKLGEGAFGTVYGGEAYINSSWIGVAVKTLKVGSNTEEKLDFLREADIMKRFDHKNIVRLLGVTTRGEPAYAVMEFMLYGDLKTYLLSRRELVNIIDSKEASDISASSLTRMAMDIIEGINYLHSKEYIHRDVACRNCLVSANRTVKIGDFGMTRRVYDDGFYVVTRGGKLPIRWMAPESFIDSMFSYKTDIWSYGVLLYEIVTFGSIPYQLQNNAEVLDTIKGGGTLTLPEECTDELKALMLDCWQTDPTRRPDASEIYVTLNNNPEMIRPLLDSPTSAEIQDQETDEVDLSPAPLKITNPFKRPMLRQSSSIISVDTGTFSRHRNHSEISNRRSASSRRRSSHSIVDLFSLVPPGNPSPVTALSMPSPSHSAGVGSTFQFTLDSRHTCDGVECCEQKSAYWTNDRKHHLSETAGEVRTENDYLLTTRSCTDIDERSNTSHTPLLHGNTEETSI